MRLTEISDAIAWNQFVDNSVWGHPLQLWGWGEAKRGNGWTPYRLALVDGGQWAAVAQVLLWEIPRMGRFIAYVPRGPVVDPKSDGAAEFFKALTGWAAEHRALYVRVEPAWTNAKMPSGWIKSRHTIQMFETYTIDLAKSEAEILEPMARKHRQYIRKAERDGVTVERVFSANELGPMMEIYAETASRAGFGIHSGEYYANLLEALGMQNYLYYARYEGQSVAFLWLAAAGPVAYELYGGVNEAGQNIKANYFLKWRAITDMKAAGKQIYDFNGRVTEGVAQFKAGFGADATDYVGAWDYPVNVAGYHAWENAWPLIKKVGRMVRGVHK